MTGQPSALAGNSIYGRCRDLCLPLTTNLTPPQIVCHDEYHIGRPLNLCPSPFQLRSFGEQTQHQQRSDHDLSLPRADARFCACEPDRKQDPSCLQMPKRIQIKQSAPLFWPICAVNLEFAAFNRIEMRYFEGSRGVARSVGR